MHVRKVRPPWEEPSSALPAHRSPARRYSAPGKVPCAGSCRSTARVSGIAGGRGAASAAAASAISRSDVDDGASPPPAEASRSVAVTWSVRTHCAYASSAPSRLQV